MTCWTIKAEGEAVRYLTANTTAETRDPDLEWPDPVDMFSAFVKAGFCVPVVDNARAVFDVEHIDADVKALRQSWRVRVEHLHPAYARVLSNLLRAAGLDVVVETDDPSGAGRVRLDTGVAYPELAPEQMAFERRYAPPSETAMVRERTLNLVFRDELVPAQIQDVCKSLGSWVEVVWRSGFAPDGAHPSSAGTLPVTPKCIDARTVAVEFQQIFIVDDRCFASAYAYARRLDESGLRLEYVQVA